MEIKREGNFHHKREELAEIKEATANGHRKQIIKQSKSANNLVLASKPREDQ